MSDDSMFAPLAHGFDRRFDAQDRNIEIYKHLVLSNLSIAAPCEKNESSEVWGIIIFIKPGQRVKLNGSQAVNVHKLLTIRYLRTVHVHGVNVFQ